MFLCTLNFNQFELCLRNNFLNESAPSKLISDFNATQEAWTGVNKSSKICKLLAVYDTSKMLRKLFHREGNHLRNLINKSSCQTEAVSMDND